MQKDSFLQKKPLVHTIRERCRVCYTCVRECPAKAIKISNGQAEVITERCIGCGNCIKVCSQNAKVFRKEIDITRELINSGSKVAALVAPSFPAEFSEIKNHRLLVSLIRALGFDIVAEVSFGADLVAGEYKRIIQTKHYPPVISSDCPAIVNYIEHYHPDLVDSLATIVSPMVAMSRVIRKKYGDDLRIVFIGPCIAKKDESDEINAALTFRELREMINQTGLKPADVAPTEFDPPLGGRGAIFPVSRGLLSTMDVTEDIFERNVIVAEGRRDFQEAIKEFESGQIAQEHLELLCCEGCIMGPGMSPYPYFSSLSRRYRKRASVSDYALHKLDGMDMVQWEKDYTEYSQLSLKREFQRREIPYERPEKEEITKALEKMGKFGPQDHLDCGACGYDSCEDHAIAIIQGLAEHEMCLPYAIEKLHNYIAELNISNEKLANTQEALRQSEKLAGMGQLSAGIAHELNNPLGIITMYSNILKDEAPQGDPIRKDLDLIAEQAERCKKIVGGLLNFARKNQVNLAAISINQLMEHSISSVIFAPQVKVSLESRVQNPEVTLDADQMAQVFTNLLKNASEAMPENGGLIHIRMIDTPEEITISIADTGTGIAEDNMSKLFTPFFTTKAIGRGTGLGLPIIYGIVKMHKGNITFKSNADLRKGPTGTTVTITLPRIPKS
ncbi:MAG TPA: [Fe-Fe] hydrogenase large subunit C-terminal domain-containing protein [Lentimicrobium sp.]|jgi:iron only hydrogenase large subunit-like protein/nitrogen-specific signal transduction histidine kinase|nr:[Fe-Fe] hydrogenase large subunit C-terminal domain-containing protein [Lentimicrobium sp.]